MTGKIKCATSNVLEFKDLKSHCKKKKISINDFATTTLVTMISKILKEDKRNENVKSINIFIPA